MIIEGKLEPHDWPRHQSPGRDHSAPFRPINRTCRVPYSATHLANSSAAKIKIFLPATLRYLIILPARLSTRFEITARTSQPFTARCNIFFSRPPPRHLSFLRRGTRLSLLLAILFIYFFFFVLRLSFFFSNDKWNVIKIEGREKKLRSVITRVKVADIKSQGCVKFETDFNNPLNY